MKITAEITTIADVDPKDFLSSLRSKILGDTGNWVFKKDGKYYRGFEVSMGQHSCEDKEEIDKDTFEVVEAIEKIYSYLSDKGIS